MAHLLKREALTQRFTLLGLGTIALTLPYAIPAIGELLKTKLGGERGIYLPKPVDNQTFYFEFSAALLIIGVCIARLFWPNRIVPVDNRLSSPDSVQSGNYRRWFVAHSLLLLAFAFFFIEVASIIDAPSARNAIGALLLPLCGLGTFGLASSLWSERRAAEKIFALAAIASIPATIYAVAQSQGYEILPYRKFSGDAALEELFAKQKVSSTFGHPNYMASYIGPVAFCALYFIVSVRTRLRRFSAVIAFVCIVAALIVGGTRGAWVGIAAGFVPFYLLLTFSPRYRRQLLFAAGLAIFVTLLIAFVPLPFFRLKLDLGKRLLASQEISQRFYYWLVALQMFKAQPLLGIGYGSFNVMFWDYVARFQQSPDSALFKFVLSEQIRGVSPGFVHNDYLQIAAETGVFALLIWLAFWSALLAQVWETAKRVRANHQATIFCAAILGAFVAFAVDGMFNFPLHIPVSSFFFWLLVGLWVARRETLLPGSTD